MFIFGRNGRGEGELRGDLSTRPGRLSFFRRLAQDDSPIQRGIASTNLRIEAENMQADGQHPPRWLRRMTPIVE